MRVLVLTLSWTLAACGAADPVNAGESSSGATTASETTADDETTSGAVTTGAPDDRCDEDPAGPGEACGFDVCDGMAHDRPCEDGLYCQAYDGSVSCGYQPPGVCVAQPASCPDDAGPPVCGCDQVLYPSECHARMAGGGTGPAEACDAPEGLFPCGSAYCQLGLHYCEHTLGHGQEETNFCRELPVECTSPIDCECIPQESCTNPENIGASVCEPHDDAWMRVICVPY